jgi:hypothetical protein
VKDFEREMRAKGEKAVQAKRSFRRESLAKGDEPLVGDNEKILSIRVIRGLSSLLNRENTCSYLAFFRAFRG